ncbi:DUF3987 domain-containing protein [Bradyrhizobium sp. TZ2]
MTFVSKFKTAGKVPFASWEAPDESLLEDRRGTLPAFPCDVFPTGLSDWLSRASRGAGCLADHVAVPMLGVASGLIGKARRVQATSSWVEPLTLWTCVIGESGSRKTPGLRTVTRALDQIEAENAPTYLDASVKHMAREEKAKAELKRWRKECAAAAIKKIEPPLMPIEAVDPGDFIFPSLYVVDSTVPRLAKLCEVRPRGMLQICDELSALFTNMKQLGARPFYLEAWNGNRFVVERVADNRSFTVDNLLVGVIGGFQPDKLSRAFAGDEDGMYGRFMFCWPAVPDYFPLTDSILEVDPAFQSLLTRLIRLPAEDENGKFAPRTIPLSAGAREEFEHYRQFVAHAKRSLEGREQQWLAKSETHVLRLAGVLTYLAWADASSGTGLESISAALEPNEIDRRFMAVAVRLVRDYFWPHARAALRQVGLTDRHRQVRRVLRWLRSNDQHEISLKDIRREALGGSVDVEGTRDLVDRLVIAGWLRALPIVQTGGRPRERWAVNSRLFEAAGTAETAESRVSAVSAVPAAAKTTKRRRA